MTQLEKEGHSDKGYHRGTGGHCAKQNKPVAKEKLPVSTYGGAQSGRSHRQEKGGARSGRRGGWELVLKRAELLLYHVWRPWCAGCTQQVCRCCSMHCTTAKDWGAGKIQAVRNATAISSNLMETLQMERE